MSSRKVMTTFTLMWFLFTLACDAGPTEPEDYVFSVDPAEAVVYQASMIQLNADLHAPSGASKVAKDVQWNSLDPATAEVSANGVVSAVEAGDVRIVAVSEGATDTALITVLPWPPTPGMSVAELPRVYLDTRYVAPNGPVRQVRAGDDLQAAINAAAPGEILELQAGAVFRGPITLPAKSGEGLIVIRSSALSALPAEGVRVGPEHAVNMPKIIGGWSNGRVVRTAARASNYRLIGLEIAIAPDVDRMNVIVDLGDPAQTPLDIPRNIILDRVFIHGHDAVSFQRCVVLNSAATAIIDSHLGDCHGKGVEAQAIVGYAGPGPFKIVNNYIAGSGINILFGGAVPAIDGLIPSDIEIRRNHIHKPLAWRNVWTVKNLFELKNAQRVLVEGNVFENNWPDAQTGYAVNLKSEKSGPGERGQWIVTQDVTFRQNLILNSPFGLTAMGKASSEAEWSAEVSRRIHIADNLWLLTDDRAFFFNGVEDLQVERNTAHAALTLEYQPLVRFIFRLNVITAPLKASGIGEGIPTLLAKAPGAVFQGNAIIGGRPDKYPTGNEFPTDGVPYVGGAGANERNVQAAIAGVAPGH